MASARNERASEERIAFSIYDDLILLFEVVALDPFKAPEKWKEVEEGVRRDNVLIDEYQCRERLDVLFKHYLRGDMPRSGTDWELAEKMRLMYNVLVMKADASFFASEERNRSVAGEILDYLRTKQQREFELRQAELNLQKRRLLLEERRIQEDKQLMELLLSKLQ